MGRNNMYFVIDGRLPSLNEYVYAERSSRMKGARLKKDTERLIKLYIARAHTLGTLNKVSSYPINVSIRWYEKDSRRDADNVFFAVKFILDSLVSYGIIKDDSRKYIKTIDNVIATDKDLPRIEVYINESIRGYEKLRVPTN